MQDIGSGVSFVADVCIESSFCADHAHVFIEAVYMLVPCTQCSVYLSTPSSAIDLSTIDPMLVREATSLKLVCDRRQLIYSPNRLETPRAGGFMTSTTKLARIVDS